MRRTWEGEWCSEEVIKLREGESVWRWWRERWVGGGGGCFFFFSNIHAHFSESYLPVLVLYH